MCLGITWQEFSCLLQSVQAIFTLYLKGCTQCLPRKAGIRAPLQQESCSALQFPVKACIKQCDQLVAFIWGQRRSICGIIRRGLDFLLTTVFVFFPTAAETRVVSSLLHAYFPLIVPMRFRRLFRHPAGEFHAITFPFCRAIKQSSPPFLYPLVFFCLVQNKRQTPKNAVIPSIGKTNLCQTGLIVGACHQATRQA